MNTNLNLLNNLRLSPDATDLVGSPAITDPLNEDLAGVNTDFPLFAPGQLGEWKVDESIVVVPEDPTKAKRWKLTVSSLADMRAVDGTPLPAGTKVFLGSQLAPTGKATMKLVQQNVASLLKMIGAAIPGRTMANVEEWIPQCNGATFRAKTKVTPPRTDKTTGKEYAATNELVAVK